MTDDTNKQKNAFGNELMKIPGVKAISFCQDFPGGHINNQSFVYNDKAQSFDQFRVDTAFFSALGIPLKNRISITDNIRINGSKTLPTKPTLSWWIFALAGLLALGIALLTVSWQSWRAATRNPVEALRYE
jgi:ABC-type antimicrobial peptide transport system permease subunit